MKEKRAPLTAKRSTIPIDHWSYRIIRFPAASAGGGDWYELHEVYFDKHKNPLAYAKASAPGGDSAKEALSESMMHRRACSQPVIDVAVFGEDEDAKPTAAVSEGRRRG